LQFLLSSKASGRSFVLNAATVRRQTKREEKDRSDDGLGVGEKEGRTKQPSRRCCPLTLRLLIPAASTKCQTPALALNSPIAAAICSHYHSSTACNFSLLGWSVYSAFLPTVSYHPSIYCLAAPWCVFARAAAAAAALESWPNLSTAAQPLIALRHTISLLHPTLCTSTSSYICLLLYRSVVSQPDSLRLFFPVLFPNHPPRQADR
ncbi:hypothetical protein KCU81_g863, partial [Aureobasidium melanogenum]